MAEALAEELRSWTQPVLDLLAGTEDPATRLLEAVNTLNETFEQQRRSCARPARSVRPRCARSRPEHSRSADLGHLRAQLVRVITELRETGSIPPMGRARRHGRAYPRCWRRHGRERHGRTGPRRSPCDCRAVRELVARSRDPVGRSRWYRVTQRPSRPTSRSFPTTDVPLSRGFAKRSWSTFPPGSSKACSSA